MIFIDYVFWGWYQILNKTIYMFKSRDHSIGPKEHSFFITFLLHGINVWNAVRYTFIEHLGKTVNLSIGLSIAVGVFTIGYFLFYRNKRSNAVISSEMNIFKASISLVLTVAYTVVTVYLMFKVGNHIRYKLYPDLPM